SCLIHNCVSTNWKPSKTRWPNYSVQRRKNKSTNAQSASMPTETPTANYKIGNERLIRITEKAAHKLESLLQEKGKPDGALRLAVVGGGCSGLQYVMDLVDGPKERDILVPISN